MEHKVVKYSMICHKILPKLLYYSSGDELWCREYLRVPYLRAYTAKEGKGKGYKSDSNYRWGQLDGTRHSQTNPQSSEASRTTQVTE